jgi:hypothetical protein
MIIILISCAVFAKVSDWRKSEEYRAQRAKQVANEAADIVKEEEQEYAKLLFQLYRLTRSTVFWSEVANISRFVNGKGLVDADTLLLKGYIKKENVYDNNGIILGSQLHITPKGMRLLQKYYGK